ncbi:MAG: hypothetical protein U0667_05585 [Chloroflexota bacterium]|jgi:hypothetical protein
MTALRASWLTWKMHRLEILVAAAILAMVGGLVMVVWFGWGAPAVRATQFEGHYAWTTYRERDQLRLGGLAYDRDQGEAVRLVPGSAFGDLERTETLVTIALGGLAILLAFPIVARRRPE